MNMRFFYIGLIFFLAVIYSWSFRLGTQGYGYAGYNGYYSHGPSFWYFGGPRYNYYGDRNVKSRSVRGGRRYTGGGIKAGK